MQETPYQTLLETLPIDTILWVVFGITVIGFGIFSATLFWHWKLYSTGKYTTVGNMVLYLTVSAGLIFVMISSIIWYSLV
jgi:hypothetical protein